MENLKSIIIGGMTLSIVIILFLGFFMLISLYEWFAAGIGFLAILMMFGLLAYLFGKMLTGKEHY